MDREGSKMFPNNWYSERRSRYGEPLTKHVVFHINRVHKHNENKKNHGLRGDNGTLFKGRIAGCVFKVPHRLEMGRLMSL